MVKEDIILVGYGGHAKSMADCIERGERFRIVGYTDKDRVDSPYPYLGTDDDIGEYFQQGVTNVAISIGYLGKGTLREELYWKLKNIGFCFPTIIDPSAIISESARLEEGIFVGKRAVINAETHIDKFCIINSGAIVEHDCRVNEFSHIAVGTILCGNVKVGCSCFVGANATVTQGKTIGNGCIIGAGAVVRRDLEDNSMFYGKDVIKLIRGVIPN